MIQVVAFVRQRLLTLACERFDEGLQDYVSRVQMVTPLQGKKEVCVTFKFERDQVVFQIPICLTHKDFDDTEMIRATRNTLHTIFSDLANQCKSWSLMNTELQELMMSNLRPATPRARCNESASRLRAVDSLEWRDQKKKGFQVPARSAILSTGTDARMKCAELPTKSPSSRTQKPQCSGLPRSTIG
jgi:hypothetical protein